MSALIHRDCLLGSEIHIDMFDDRQESQSPGGNMMVERSKIVISTPSLSSVIR